MNNLMRIGQLAKKCDLTVEAIRYYEVEQLLSPKQRSSSGYRLYDSSDQNRLNFILHAKKVGFSLQEIKNLLSLRTNKNSHTCEEVKRYTGVKINEIEQKINDLLKMKSALDSLHYACCGGDESAINCTILNSLDDPEYFSKSTSHQPITSLQNNTQVKEFSA